MVEGAHGYLDGVGGLRLFYRAWEITDARGKILLVHGLGEHSGRYRQVASVLNGAGFNVYGLDLRGHGRSQGRRGHVRRFEHLLQDVDRLRRRVCGAKPCGDPVFLLGHSLGGLVALRYMREFACRSLCGAVIVAPFVEIRMPVPGWKLALGRLADRFVPALTLDNGLRREKLFREEDEREAYRTDPLVHRRISARLWAEMRRAAEALRGPDTGEAHLLFQVPGDDRIVNSRAALALASELGEGSEVREYPEAYHDLYHDPLRESALRDAAAWIADRSEASAAA
ncbi:MAG: alpha/beta hydrolase [Gemmatimonadota bacterium]